MTPGSSNPLLNRQSTRTKGASSSRRRARDGDLDPPRDAGHYPSRGHLRDAGSDHDRRDDRRRDPQLRHGRFLRLHLLAPSKAASNALATSASPPTAANKMIFFVIEPS
jgi:hypothetical protein